MLQLHVEEEGQEGRRECDKEDVKKREKIYPAQYMKISHAGAPGQLYSDMEHMSGTS